MAETKKVWTNGTLTYTTAGVVMLFCWLLWGDFAWGLKERAVAYVAGLMVKSYGISNFWYAVLMTAYPCFTNIFLMPAISFWSDRHRGRLGRRIPFLLFTTPFVVLGLAGLAMTPMLGEWLQGIIGADKIALNMCRLIFFAISWAILDFGTTLTNALFLALANDVVPTSLIGRFLAMFRMMSLFCAVFFNYSLMGYAESHATYIFAGLAVFYGVGLYSLCWKVKEGKYPPPAEDDNKPRNLKEAVKVYFRECFSLPYYRWAIIGLVLCRQSVLAVNTYVIFYAKDLGMTTERFGKMMAVVFLGAFILSFLWGVLADKYHPIRCGIASVAVLMSLQAAGGFFINNVTTFMVVFMLHETLIMSFNTLTASYPQRLFPRAYFAQYNSALDMVQALSAVLLAPVIGKILDLLGSNYRYIFTIGSVIGFCGFLSLFIVYRYFISYGGDKNYVAPEVARRKN